MAPPSAPPLPTDAPATASPTPAPPTPPSDTHDDDLDEFIKAQQPKRAVHPVRFVLAVAATLAVGWILIPTADELAFHLSRQHTPLDVGDASPAVLARVADGTWVRAVVVLGNKAAEIPEWRKGSLRFGPIEVREVVGAPLYLEFDPREFPHLDPFVQTEVEGRLISFDADGELGEVRRYFEGNLRAAVAKNARAIVVGEKPGGLSQYLTAWIGGVALVVLSWTSLARRLRG